MGSGTHRPDPQRLEGLARIEPPHTKKELRKILGVFGYYREYIPHYSEIAQPMTDLTSSKVPNVLGDRWLVRGIGSPMPASNRRQWARKGPGAR